MGNLARIGGAAASAIALVVGLLGLVHSWPQWVLISLGVAGLVAIVFQFFWERRDNPGEQGVNIARQHQRSGAGSQNWQAGRDLRFEGGAGDRGNQPPT
jgi:sugar phosphate permease